MSRFGVLRYGMTRIRTATLDKTQEPSNGVKTVGAMYKYARSAYYSYSTAHIIHIAG